MNENQLILALSMLTESERKLIINEYVQFKKDGHIGSSLIRDIANKSPSRMVVIEMTFVAMDCYRYFAEKYLELNIVESSEEHFLNVDSRRET